MITPTDCGLEIPARDEHRQNSSLPLCSSVLPVVKILIWPRSSPNAAWRVLPLVNFLHSFDGVRIFWTLVRAQPHDARETQCVTTLVARRTHHVVECHLENDPRLQFQPQPFFADLVGEEPLRHFRDLGISEPSISFADIYQVFIVPHRKCVVTEHADAL